METVAQTCVRLLVALEDLSEQEAAALAERDFSAVAELQARAEPLVQFLGTHGPAVADDAFLRRVRTFLQRRQALCDVLAEEIARTQEALRETRESFGRVARIAPVYGSVAVPVAERLCAVG